MVEYLSHEASYEALMLACADKLSNLRSIAADYEAGVSTHLATGLTSPIRLPRSNVLSYSFPGGRLVIRPSGTEPKLKCYLEVILPVTEGEPLPWDQARERLDAIKGAFAEIIGF